MAVRPVSVLPVLVLVPFSPGLEPNGFVFRISVPLFSIKTGVATAIPSLLALATQSSRLVWCPPAPGRWPDASPLAPRSRVALPAASESPQALRAASHTTRRRARPCPACRLSLPHSFSPSGVERGMLTRPRLRRSWRSRHRPPLRHTGRDSPALPWRLQRFSASRRLRRVSVPPEFGSYAYSDSALCSQRVAFEPAKPTT